MTDLPHPWDAYLRLQEKLSRKTQIDNKSWGYEAGLNKILASNPAITPPQPDEIQRTIANAERRDRYNRAQLRSMQSEDERSPNTAGLQVEAREELALIKDSVSPADWALLVLVGVGHDYAYIAALQNSTAGRLRAHVLRLRRSLKTRHG